MRTGAVIFAQNTNKIDYVKLAVNAAKRVKEHLNIPVAIITDSKKWLEKNYPDHPFDDIVENFPPLTTQKRKFHDGTLISDYGEWKNFTRGQVYNLTPYDKTLVIDADYIINSSILQSALNSNYDLQIYRNSMDLADWRDTSEFERVNLYSIPFYWATVFVFQKNSVMESFFNLIAYIKLNWLYFRVLYNIESTIFRNDFAFSIAIHIMNGKTNGEFAVELPGKMIYTYDRDLLVSTSGNKMQFLIEKKDYSGEYILSRTEGLDIHVMNKYSLSRCIDGGNGV